MPEVTRFDGVVIKMFFKPREHEPSHIYALYGEFVGIFELDTFQMIEGDLPGKIQEHVKEWIARYQSELKEMWDTQEIKKLPPL